MTSQAPIHSLPDNYIQAKHIVATEPKTLLWLNIASLVPLALALLLMSWWGDLVRRLRGPYSTAFSESFPWYLAVIVVLVLTFGGHELTHGLVIGLLGHRPRFGVKLDKGVFYATADNALFWRGQFVLIALAPLLGLTLLCMLLLLIVPDTLGYYVGLIVVLNAAGSIGDLWMSAEVLRYPADALVRDEADSIRIYVSG